jgi:Flp pilus assembly protein TadG
MSAPAPGPRSKGFMTRLRRDQRGISAVEFALLAPVMIAFYFGLTEFCQGYMAQKRLSHTASAVGDLVAQTDTLTRDQLDDIIAIGSMIMKPFNDTTLTTRISSVTRDANGVAKVDWSRAHRIAPLRSNATESLIMTETSYDYASPIQYLMPAVTKFSNVFYLRPRRVEKVTCSNCPAT